MYKIYFKNAIKNIKRQPLYSFISILVLSLGLTSVITLFIWITNEKSFDKFNIKYNEIYRVVINGKIDNLIINSAHTGSPLAKSLVNNFPVVKKATRILNVGSVEASCEEQNVSEVNVLGVDSSFFKIFSVDFIQGSSREILTNPNEAIITRKTAVKLFGDKDAINKNIEFSIDGEKRNFLITGIVNEFPVQSHFHFDVLFSMNTLNWTNNEQWLSTDFFTYILLQKGIDLDSFKERLNDFTSIMIAPVIKGLQNNSNKEWKNSKNYFKHDLQKLTDIHLHSDFNDEFEQNGDIAYIKLFYFILLLLLISTVSIFINLTKVRLNKASKEIYVRKVHGASTMSIFQRFIFEIILLVIISLIVSFIFLETLVPLIQKSIDVSSMIYNGFTVFVSILMFVLVIIFVGFTTIPSFAKINLPILASSKHFYNTKKVNYNLLMMIQLIISVIVIFGTLVIRNQLQFMENEKLGMNKEGIITIRGIIKLGDKLDVYKNTLLENSNIKHASYSYTLAGKQFPNIACKKIDENSSESFVMSFCPCDDDFKDVFQLQMKEGRFFSKDFSTDSKTVIINETAANLLKFSNPINESIEFGGEHFRIIGVVKDFHFDTKQKEIKPMVFVTMPSVYSHWLPNFLSVKVNSNNIKSTIDFMQIQWNKYASESLFTYSFFEFDYDKLYSKEAKAKHLLFIFSILSLIIVVIGLISISLENIQQRTKEIGIRKVNGATIIDILKVLNQKYMYMSIISLVIALPIAYYLANDWLHNFAYRVEINLWIYLLTSSLILLITLITISFQSYKAALQNPVETLKYE